MVTTRSDSTVSGAEDAAVREEIGIVEPCQHRVARAVLVGFRTRWRVRARLDRGELRVKADIVVLGCARDGATSRRCAATTCARRRGSATTTGPGAFPPRPPPRPPPAGAAAPGPAPAGAPAPPAAAPGRNPAVVNPPPRPPPGIWVMGRRRFTAPAGRCVPKTSASAKSVRGAPDGS